MASFYLDHDISADLQPALQAIGHDVLTTRDLSFQRANDAAQLLRAARLRSVLVSHNGADFVLLQAAWRLWPVAMQHSGILIIPQQRWTVRRTVDEIDRVTREAPTLTNELYYWKPSQGWVRRVVMTS